MVRAEGWLPPHGQRQSEVTLESLVMALSEFFGHNPVVMALSNMPESLPTTLHSNERWIHLKG